MKMNEFDLDNLEAISEDELKSNMHQDGITMIETVKAQIENGFYDAAVSTLVLAKSYLDGSAHEQGRAIREFKRD